jgi:hypothetical protein
LKIRSEIEKAGVGFLYYLRMNFFANYSAIVQALMSRMDAILNRLNKLIEKDLADSSKSENVIKKTKV